MCNLPRPHAAPAIEGWDNYCKSLAKFFIFLTQPIPSRKKKINDPLTQGQRKRAGRSRSISTPPPPSPPRLHWQEWHVSHIMNSVCVKSLISIQSCIIKQQGHDVGVLVSLSGAARCSETIRAGACCDSDPSLARPVTAAQFKKKKKRPCTFLTQCETSPSRIIAYTRCMIGHWIEMPTDKSPRPGGCLTSSSFFFFYKLHTFVSFHSKFLPTSVFIVSKDVSVEFCSERHDATEL